MDKNSQFEIQTADTNDFITIDSYVKNTGQNLIMITEDKVRICLMMHLNSLEKSRNWLIPLTLLISFLITLITSDPHDAFGLKADVWKAIFVLGAIIFFIWLIITLLERKKAISLDELIIQFKSQANPSIPQSKPEN